MVSFDFSFAGIGSLGAMMLIALVFFSYFFAIHLIVTWNPYHRPVIPLISSLILSLGPMLAMAMKQMDQFQFPKCLRLLSCLQHWA